MVQGTPSASDPPSAKVRVPKPKPFGGLRNVKELENFLWDMEQYFIAARIPVNVEAGLFFREYNKNYGFSLFSLHNLNHQKRPYGSPPVYRE